MMIGQLAARTGLPVRTLRFYADAGVLPEAGRNESGYRLFDAGAVARARLVRTLRELGVGLDDVKRVLAAEASLQNVAAAHACALDAQIRVLRLQRAVLRAVARSTRPEELQRMTDLTTLTTEEPAASSRTTSAPSSAVNPARSPTDCAWGRRSCRMTRPPIRLPPRLSSPSSCATPTTSNAVAGWPNAPAPKAPSPTAATPTSRQSLSTPAPPSGPASTRRRPRRSRSSSAWRRSRQTVGGQRAELAERLEAFIDRRALRYWTLVGIVNGWKRPPVTKDSADACEWYAQALRAHA